MTADPLELVVIDASAMAIVLASGHADADALAWRLRHATLVAPTHLPVEVDSLLRGLERGGRITTKEADAARAAFTAVPIDLWEWRVVADRAWELRANLTTYDAGYVALAERLDGVLVTADARIAGAPGIRCAVEVVGS